MSDKLLKVSEHTRFYKYSDGEIYKVAPQDIRMGDTIFIDDPQYARPGYVDNSIRLGLIQEARYNNGMLLLNTKDMMAMGRVSGQERQFVEYSREKEHEFTYA